LSAYWQDPLARAEVPNERRENRIAARNEFLYLRSRVAKRGFLYGVGPQGSTPLVLIEKKRKPMATPSIVPNDLQARTERLRNRALFSEAKKVVEPRVKVHRCFNQLAGQEKPKSCSCKDKISFADASGIIARGEADWLLVRNPKTNNLVKFERAIVARASKQEIKAQAKQLQTYHKNETAILERFRKLLEKEVSKGDLPPAVLKISEMELRAYLGSPETLRDIFPEFGIDPLWGKVVKLSSDFWINHADAVKISEDSGRFMKLAPQGRGKVVTGGYDSEKLEQIGGFDLESACEAGNLKELGGMFRVCPKGYGPDQFENDRDDAE
jgi:hypothetical protein